MPTKNQLDLIKRLEAECKKFEKRYPKTLQDCSDYIDYLKLKAGKMSHFHRSIKSKKVEAEA